MFGILAVIAFAIAWIEHAGKISVNSTWFDQQGLLYLGLALLTLHLIWGIAVPWRRHHG